MFKSLQKIQKLGRGTEKCGFQKKEKEKSFYLHVSGFRKYNFELKSKGENDRELKKWPREETEGEERDTSDGEVWKLRQSKDRT